MSPDDNRATHNDGSRRDDPAPVYPAGFDPDYEAKTPGMNPRKHLSRVEWEFVCTLLALRCAVWTASPAANPKTEFKRPLKWQQITPDYSHHRLYSFQRGDALKLNTGTVVGTIDVDPRNGGDIDSVRGLLTDLKVRHFAEVKSPSGGRHFYVAGHPLLMTLHNPDGYPGVDILGNGACCYLPGTLRPKHDRKGYEILFNDLDALRTEGDPEGAEHLAQWVADQKTSGTGFFADGLGDAPLWSGREHSDREKAYLAKVLTNTSGELANSLVGERNNSLFIKALKCGSLISGAGLDDQRAAEALKDGADRCNLTQDDGEACVWATIGSGLAIGMGNPRGFPQSPGTGCDAFWEQTDTLRHIRDYAWARRVAPWAVLGVELCRIICTVPPMVRIHPYVGDVASLNLYVGLVGESGEGKGGAMIRTCG
jgi:hypothetical protein